MGKKALLSAVAAMAAISSAALADDRRAPPADWLSVGEIAGKLSQAGLNATKIEIDDGLYEANARDASGKRLKLKIDPKTGTIISQRERRARF